MTGDRTVNYSDFFAFRSAYNAAHGAGEFATLVAQVPEPSSAVLAIVP